MRIKLLSVACAVLLIAGCGGGKSSDKPKSAGPDISKIKIHGDRSVATNKLAIEAIADLQSYWSKEFPKLYGKKYTKVSGGLYALTSKSTAGPKCANSYADVQGNAFYCKLDDSVAWDAEGLLPDLQKKFGNFVIPVVLAHEWGHAMQQRSGFFSANQLTVSSELQADCFAGGWSKHAQKSGAFKVTSAQLDTALAGILDLRDQPGSSATDQSAHGSGFDRVSAFQNGFDNGTAACRPYHDGNPVVLELPFKDAGDASRGGDAPYKQIVDPRGVPSDLEDYWTQVFPEISDGKKWAPLKGYEPFDPSKSPPCGDSDTSGYSLFYCVPGDYVAFDTVNEMPTIYQQGGDYAVTTLLATQWGLAALARLGDPLTGKTADLQGDCFAGAYTASVALQNRKTSNFSLSPGDLDEGIKALLVFRGQGDVARQGAGYGRVKAFRSGVIDGVQPCLTYKP